VTKQAIDAPRLNMFSMDPGQLVIVMDEKHPLYDPRAKLDVEESMIRNVMVNGVIEPVIVTKEGNLTLVVAGRQRVKAALAANMRLETEGKKPIRVPCIVRRGSETDLFGVSISENENRKDDTPLSRAQKAQKLLNMGATEEETAIAFGVTVQSVRGWGKLLECSAPVRKAVESGRISASAATKLVGLPREKQAEALDAALTEPSKPGKKNGRPTARRVAQIAGKPEARMRSRREIMTRLETPKLHPIYREALQWVLGQEPDHVG